MPKWKQEYSTVWMGEKGGCAISANTAMRIVAAHNADIDALTADRDELQRRLDAVVAAMKPGKPPCDCITEIGPRCSCMNQGDAANVEAWWTTMCHYRQAVAIAEGREG